ncbi:hypothetical protein Pcac1_g27952 [Phytophthora cactorum]|nr:hypothetical protein Pcac1_g27952 [Phytophthora cactorum]KAG2875098.1 hypothetical protein PC114_g24919 [Phytophthora cactorum]KAG2986205.1 hypothetical protein PC120_g23875 [Phytophthora cactorum]
MLPSVFNTDETSRSVSKAAALSSTRFLYCSTWYSPTESVDSIVEVLACAGTEVVVPADAGMDVAESAETDSCAGVFVGELIPQ